MYIFLCMFQIKHTLVDSMWGHIKVPEGECHSVCLEPPFPSLWWEGNQSIYFGIPLKVTTSAQVTRCMCRLSHQKWTRHHWSIIWWCTNDVGLSDDDIYVRVGGMKGRMHGGRGSAFWDFKCRTYRAELIFSSVFWCVPTSGQPGIYTLQLQMCLVYWLISIAIFLQSELHFY